MPLFLKFTDSVNLFLSVVTAPPGVEELKPPGEETSPAEVPKESPKVEEQPKKEGTPPTKVSLRFLCLNDVLLSSSVCSDVHYGRMLVHFFAFFFGCLKYLWQALASLLILFSVLFPHEICQGS